MRLNKFVAQATGLSRRKADEMIAQGLVRLNGDPGKLGDKVTDADTIQLGGKIIRLPVITTLLLNKPAGYICSRNGQGSKTIYDILPKKWHHLKPIGRLDKDSSGVLLLSNDGDLSNRLAHPRYKKEKIYIVQLDKNITPRNFEKLKKGIVLEDGRSKFTSLQQLSDCTYKITISEGRNRQIRRTFEALDYQTISLHRIKFGPHKLSDGLEPGQWKILHLDKVGPS